MSNVANWVEETTSTTGTGAVTLGNPVAGQTTFVQAFGTGVTDVLYSIESGNNRESGTGSYNGTTEVLTRTTPVSTLVAGVYDDTSPTPITLTGTSTVRCTYNAESHVKFVEGPSSSVDNRLAIFDGITGKLVKQAAIIENDVFALSVDNQLALISEKITPVDGDFFIIEDSENAGAKRKFDRAGLPSNVLNNAVFPNWAGFAVQGSTAAVDAGNTDVNFGTSNKHALTGTASTTINTFTFPQANAHYFLLIPSTITISGVTATNKQEYGTNDLTAGKAHVMSVYWDGTTAHWQTSEEP